MRTIQGLENYKLTEVQNIVLSHVDYLRENFHFEGLDFLIQDITPFGSRVSGLAKKNSDLDIKVKYTGNAREDDLFNALNERKTKLKIENIKIDFYPEKIEVWAFPRRGNWATHASDWRGNWSPEVARNLILRYSKEGEVLLDSMIGGGTTAIEAKILNRNIIYSDVNQEALDRTKKSLDFKVENKSWQRGFKWDSRNLSKLEANSIDLILTHPPYVDIIKYSEGKLVDDLSNIHDIETFCDEMEKVAKEFFRVLKPGKFCAILMGDTRRNKMYQPLAYKVMDRFLKAGLLLKEDIIKRQFNCKATGFWVTKSKESNFLLIMHEHLFVFQKIK